MLNKEYTKRFLRVAMCQTSAQRPENFLKHFESNLSRALEYNPDIITFGGSINGSTKPNIFNEVVYQGLEDEDQAPLAHLFSRTAKETNTLIISGLSTKVPTEVEGEYKMFSSAVAFSNTTGELLCEHQKLHLCEVDLPGLKQSDSQMMNLTAGVNGVNVITHPSYPELKIGVAGCYDVRFREIGLAMAQNGADILCFASAFHSITGALHLDLINRSRAVDTQCYVISAQRAKRSDEQGGHAFYGHSSIINPSGLIVAQAGQYEEIITAEIDLEMINKVRSQFPYANQRRLDVYEVEIREDN